MSARIYCSAAPTTVTQTVTTTHVPTSATQRAIPARGSSQAQGYSNQDIARIRKVNQDDTRQHAYDGPAPQDGYDADLARQKSIPRKQVGTSANAPYSSAQFQVPSNGQLSHSRNQSAPKPLPSVPVSSTDGYELRRTEAMPQSTSVLDRSRPISRGVNGPRDVQDVIKRAKTNTYDTEVIEKVAPGKLAGEAVPYCQMLNLRQFQPLSTRPSTKRSTIYAKSASLAKYTITTSIIEYFLSSM